MRRFVIAALSAVVLVSSEVSTVWADDKLRTITAQTTPEDAVRITLVKSGDDHSVQSVSGGGTSAVGCSWTSRPADRNGLAGDVELPVTGGPGSGLVLYDVFCDGVYHSSVWVGPEDVVDVDAVVRGELERYVREVLAPVVRIGVNPSGSGLVGLASWFWIEGFSGSVAAPPISAFGMSVDVRMSSGTVRWDFGDGSVEVGDLGRAYPEESSVQHRFQRHGTYDVTAQIELVPEYSVNGGPWLTLPDLSVSAAATHPVEQRQPVLTSR